MKINIKTENIENFLFYDIETVSRNEELEVDSREYTAFQWKNRLKDQNDDFLTDNELQELYKKKAALDPAYNKIVCISVGFVKGDTLFYKSIVGEQKDIIEEFYSILSGNRLIPVGYNNINFDTPVTRIKAIEEDILNKLLDKYSDSGKKPWDMDKTYVDLMGVMKGTYYYSMSFEEACIVAKVDSPKCDINGSQVTETYYKEGVERIAKYCNRDVIACAELFCVLAGKRGFIKNFVDKSDASTDSPELTAKIPFLKRLCSEESISGDVEEELRSIIGKKKLTKKDKDNLETILLNCLVNTDFINNNQDTKKVLQSKADSVTNFIKSL